MSTYWIVRIERRVEDANGRLLEPVRILGKEMTEPRMADFPSFVRQVGVTAETLLRRICKEAKIP